MRCSNTFRLFGSCILPWRQPCVRSGRQTCLRSGRRTYVPTSSARMQCCSGNRAPPSNAGGCSGLWRALQLRLQPVLHMHPALHQPCVRSGKRAYEPTSSAQADGRCFCGVRCSCDFSLCCACILPCSNPACAEAGGPINPPAQPRPTAVASVACAAAATSACVARTSRPPNALRAQRRAGMSTSRLSLGVVQLSGPSTRDGNHCQRTSRPQVQCLSCLQCREPGHGM